MWKAGKRERENQQTDKTETHQAQPSHTKGRKYTYTHTTDRVESWWICDKI